MIKIRYPAEGIEIEVPAGTTLLEASLSAHLPNGSACGGVCACSTCHVRVKKGAELLSSADDDEQDILDRAFDVRADSRLGCQARIQRDGEIEVELTRETIETYANEHPAERAAIAVRLERMRKR